jgi:uncharacterized OB-fold protein
MTTTVAESEMRQNPWSKPYWDGVAQRVLRYQHCGSCQRNVFPARRYCPCCASEDLQWRESSGRGRLYSYSVVELGALPDFQDQVPYIIAVVELDEGFRMTSRLQDAEPDSVECDSPVEVSFTWRDGRLPCFVPSSAARNG